MEQFSEFLFSPWTWVFIGLLVVAIATYMWYAYLEHKWPFRRKDW